MNEQELYDFREALDTQKEEEIIRLAQIYGNVNVSKGFPFAWSSSLNVDVSLPLLYCVLMRKPAAASILLGKCGAVPEAMDEKAHLNALELADKVDAAREGPAQAEMLPVLKVFGFVMVLVFQITDFFFFFFFFFVLSGKRRRMSL
jgi:hypothetical protein